ncbi:alpha/beta fold hydrolase [Streptomyces tsukubensis]|uniref:Alpha/beta hydrolase n=1 Tax=Streptomyces tsukubensis TaxID=83656 RepID=A0A1V4ABI3_9ACTN|nr:alpha/beta hydrolase [Streptomyces tsukubensis]OON80641.1 alpha/beta hydrolase [Streptomyces tsukubensis]QFR96301.1 alpha/beta fold hydrolase [Streptomyces tsukubensis]
MSYAEINGLSLYYEEHGPEAGGLLLLLHGGFGSGESFAPLLPDLARHRRVVTVDLQGHGRTADIDRPLRAALMADDVAALVGHLGRARADVLGYSMGAKVALRTAVQHPGVVGRVVLVSAVARRDGWFPEVLAGMDAMSEDAAAPMKQTPLYELYERVAPRPQDWPALVRKTAEMLQESYDWTQEVAAVTAPVLLVYADCDSVRPAHMAEFFGLLGGGLRDAVWDGSGRTTQSRLAVLPGTSHYDIMASPGLSPAVLRFLDEAKG